MRFIDADSICVCGKYIKTNEKFEPYIMIDDLVKLLDEQPTAYDIDKVVEELEHTMSNDGLPSEIIWNNALKMATEIVKNGGVDDDVCERRLIKGYKFLRKTSCGNTFDMENNFKYCQFCGKKIKIVGD